MTAWHGKHKGPGLLSGLHRNTVGLERAFLQRQAAGDGHGNRNGLTGCRGGFVGRQGGNVGIGITGGIHLNGAVVDQYPVRCRVGTELGGHSVDLILCDALTLDERICLIGQLSGILRHCPVQGVQIVGHDGKLVCRGVIGGQNHPINVSIRRDILINSNSVLCVVLIDGPGTIVAHLGCGVLIAVYCKAGDPAGGYVYILSAQKILGQGKTGIV